MRRFLAARRAACCIFVVVSLARAAAAQTWNDSLSLTLIDRAITRRAQQLADTGLTDYQATAHGYVSFLAQLGQGFRTPPKIIKADELELEVYWHAPNQSKQRIVGRRDTLLLPTDIAYHRDHLGIVQNNFPNIIRIGEGDEVRDVPHPLSPSGTSLYDFALADSFAIGSGTQRIQVYEVKVRPKNDRAPRVVGAVYIDRATAQVVRMNFSFTRAAFIDQALEQLSVVLENRLVSGRFWLPSRQEVEIQRGGEWLDYPVRGIIRGRWEIGDYRFNLALAPTVFTGPEIVQAPPSQLKQYVWKGAILDSLPPDVRAVTDADIQRVQEEAHQLVRAQALARAQQVTMSMRNVSDIARFNRVEGFAVGDGLAKQFGNGFRAATHARYGVDDHSVKGNATLSWQHASGFGIHAFAMRDFRDVGDQPERSTVMNSLASQEFGSDETDPYLVRGGGIGLDFPAIGATQWRLDAGVERQDPLAVHARPVVGAFEPTVAAFAGRVARTALSGSLPAHLSFLGTEVSADGEARWTRGLGGAALDWTDLQTMRGHIAVNVERPFGAQRLESRTTIGGTWTSAGRYPPQEMMLLGGSVSAPGYDFHSLVARAAATEHLEWRLPAPFIPFSLGRFGRVPARGTFAPYVHGVILDGGGVRPAIGAAYLTPFDLLRVDVARGVGRGGRWTFNIDVSREFWSIL